MEGGGLRKCITAILKYLIILLICSFFLINLFFLFDAFERLILKNFNSILSEF